MLTWKDRILFVVFFVIGALWSSPALKGEVILPEKPQIEIHGDIVGGQLVSITVSAAYPKWQTYFATSGVLKEYPSTCVINPVGGAVCQPEDTYEFVVEVPIAEEIWLFARTTFGDVVSDTEIYRPIGADDYYRVRPREVSEYMYYLANDNLGGNWISTGIQSAEAPFSYTTPSPGVFQVTNPITGTFVFTYFVDTNQGRLFGNIFLEVTPEAPKSLFPDLKDDHFVMDEGATRSFNLLTNDLLPGDRSIGFGIDDVEGDVEYDLPTIGGLQVISPATGTYTFTYYVDVLGIGRDTAQAVLHVRPTNVGPPATTPHETWLPSVLFQTEEEEMPILLPD